MLIIHTHALKADGQKRERLHELVNLYDLVQGLAVSTNWNRNKQTQQYKTVSFTEVSYTLVYYISNVQAGDDFYSQDF